MKERGAVFSQSLNDFPCTVELGKKIPSWGIKRWAGCSGLRFVPDADEGFTLRGDKRRLVYKGRRRSHRFTILGDSSFEYDCILLREPEHNVIALQMEGAECFDFFRQPDFVKNPFLKGSYAVYKKETLIGEGTGKLCHIHRPLIIDALGRKVWGDLAVVGNELRITIPEQWLAEAKYPVVVDPTVGTATVGAFNMWEYPDEYYDGFEDDYDMTYAEYLAEWDYKLMELDNMTITNRCYVPEKINGECTAYAYTYKDHINAGGYGVLYYNKIYPPSAQEKLSCNEQWFSLRAEQSQPGWKTGNFSVASPIEAGTYVWFGISTRRIWYPVYDWGGDCNWGLKEYEREPPEHFSLHKWPVWHMYKPSMYFTYTNAQNFVRSITQGVTLADSRKTVLDFKRTTAQNATVNEKGTASVEFKRLQAQNVAATDSGKWSAGFNRILSQIASAADNWKNKIDYLRTLEQDTILTDSRKLTADYRRVVAQTVTVHDDRLLQAEYRRDATELVNGITEITRIHGFFRHCYDTVSNFVNLARLPIFERTLSEQLPVNDYAKHSRGLNRQCDEAVTVQSITKREQGFFSEISDILFTTDANRYSIIFVRAISETQGITDAIRHLGNYIRGLYAEAGNVAETVRWGDYYRKEHDVVQVEGSALRHLFVFIRILTTSLVRDFLLRRFLIAREELVLKSCITRNITIESKIN